MNPIPFVYAFSLIGALIHWLITRPKTWSKTIEIVLLYQLIFSVGINCLFGFYGHAFMSNEIAHYIGWPAGNPFQLEVAYTNLAFGILGILCLWFKEGFWLATILGISIWYWANAYGHIKDLILNNNTAPGNAGLPLYADIILPIVLLSLWTAYKLLSKQDKKQQLGESLHS